MLQADKLGGRGGGSAKRSVQQQLPQRLQLHRTAQRSCLARQRDGHGSVTA